MAVSPEYRAYLEDLFQPIEGATFRGMFGGLGVFHDGAMFALVAYERLYFKVDLETKPQFANAGSEPFVYEGKGKAIEDWARLGVEAARRAASAKPKKKPRKRKS